MGNTTAQTLTGLGYNVLTWKAIVAWEAAENQFPEE
jgi:hypothetical protein